MLKGARRSPAFTPRGHSIVKCRPEINDIEDVEVTVRVPQTSSCAGPRALEREVPPERTEQPLQNRVVEVHCARAVRRDPRQQEPLEMVALHVLDVQPRAF